MFQQILTLSRNTFIESIRQPVCVVLIIAGSLLLWMNSHLAAYTFEDDNKMMIDLGLSMLFVTGLLLAAFIATGVLSGEIENQTVLTVVSKPVARPLFVLSKYLGVSAAMGMAYWVMVMTYLLNVRHKVMQTASDPIDWPVVILALLAFLLAVLIAAIGNYLYHWVFTSSFMFSYVALNTVAWLIVLVIDKRWQFQSITTEFVLEDSQLGQLLIALLMLFEALLMLAAVAIAVSTRFGQVMTLVICFAVFLLGLVSNSIYLEFGQAFVVDAASDLTLVSVLFARLFYWIMPNLQFLWQADALTSAHAIPFSHVLLVSGYSVLYIGGLLLLSISLFQTREVG